MSETIEPVFEAQRTTREAKGRTRVQLTESEEDAATAIAEREGLQRGPWIAKVLRAVIADAAEPSPAEMRALVQATAEMRALTVALSRLSRALERATAGEVEEAPRLDELAAMVGQMGARLDVHAETTTDALRASHERWAIRAARGER